MADLAEWPDVETALIDVLGDLATVSTAVPPDPDGTLEWLPMIRVACHGGRDDRVTDLSRVTVDTFAATWQDARDLAGQVRQRLLNGPHHGDNYTLDRASTDVKPNMVPYVDNPPPHRYTAAYSLTARRTP